MHSKSLLLDGDAGQDAIKRINNTYGITTRIGGALQVIGGLGTATVSSGMVVAGSASCPETLGAGCAAAGAGYAGLLWSADQGKSGTTTVITGKATPTLGGQLASNLFGVSPETGELLNSLVGLSPLAMDAALTNRAINAQMAANAQAKGTYAGANSAAQTNLLTRIAQDGHALERHGGSVTDQQLLTRALTGIAPDGSSVVRDGQTVIPPSSTAFNSDALLVQSDQFIRQNYLDRAIALAAPGAQRVTIEGVDMGINIGRGFDRVSSAPGVAGPLQFNSNLSRATAVYSYDAAAGVWRTVTIYPVK